MEDLFNDPAILEQYKYTPKPGSPADQESVGSVPVLDWIDTFKTPYAKTLPVEELTESKPLLRVILPNRTFNHDALSILAKQFSIPSAFLEEETRSANHSFGSLDTRDGYRCCWFSYIYKTITVTESPDSDLVIADPRPTRQTKPAGDPSIRQTDFTWTQARFFLRWCTEEGAWSNVTLICLGQHKLRSRLMRIPYKAVAGGVVRDPLSLFVVILHELSGRMDYMGWELARVFAGIEIIALALIRNRESFTGLHNISKHIIYLQESSDAALETVKNLRTHHGDISRKETGEERAAGQITRRTIAQVEAEFQAFRLRLRSLDRRMQNVIQLSFHLVTQEGNEYLQSDSSTMATIALVTLIFLPITTVSTIFGSQFFNASPDNSSIEVSKDFWIFWVVSIPLTLAVLLGWSLWQKEGFVKSHVKWKDTLKAFVPRQTREKKSDVEVNNVALPELRRMGSWQS